MFKVHFAGCGVLCWDTAPDVALYSRVGLPGLKHLIGVFQVVTPGTAARYVTAKLNNLTIHHPHPSSHAHTLSPMGLKVPVASTSGVGGW